MIYPPSEPTTRVGQRTNREIVVALLAMAFVMAILVLYTRDLWCGYASLLCLPTHEASAPATAEPEARAAAGRSGLGSRPPRLPTASPEPVVEPPLGAPGPEDLAGFGDPFAGDPFGAGAGLPTLAPVIATQPSLAFPTQVVLPTPDFGSPESIFGGSGSASSTPEGRASAAITPSPSRAYPGPDAVATASATPT